MKHQIDGPALRQTLADLVRINSVNPDLVPGSPGEAEIARYVAEYLGGLGLEVSWHEPKPGRVSVVGTLPGRGSGRSLMLNAHYDTVGVEGMDEPFSAQVRDGRLYGRGSYDMKGSLAACLAAASALAEYPKELSGDLLIAAVADEEYASLGTADLVKRYRVDGAVVTEPTELDLCLAHKGFVWLEVETHGRAYHGSRFDKGIDANMMMGRFLHELDKLEKDLRHRPGHALVGPPSLHAAMIEGGAALSVYSARCRLKVERRTIPGETETTVADEFRKILKKLSDHDSRFDAELRTLLTRDPFEIEPSAPIVRSLERASQQVLDRVPRHTGQNPWMDSALLASAGVETVVFGPAGAGAHSDEEWVDLDSVEKLAEILVKTALDYCR